MSRPSRRRRRLKMSRPDVEQDAHLRASRNSPLPGLLPNSPDGTQFPAAPFLPLLLSSFECITPSRPLPAPLIRTSGLPFKDMEAPLDALAVMVHNRYNM